MWGAYGLFWVFKARKKPVSFPGPFPCLNCGEKLQFYDNFTRICSIAGLVVLGLLSAAMGLNGIGFVFATLGLWIPIGIALGGFVALLVPPKIERYVSEHFTLFPR